ncbi:MAG: OsmC family protein [Ignavibacteriaceae bacterium]
MPDVHYYETTVKWDKDRIGNISADGMPDVTVATPPEFPKGVPDIWSPEHLFVASVNICLMTTFLAIADNSNLQFKSFSSKAKGKLEKVDGKFAISEIELNPSVTVTQEKDVERAKRIIDKAEQNCLISNSIKSKIILNPEVNLEA